MFTLKSASLVAVASHISQLQRDSNTGLKLYRISEELRSRALGAEDGPTSKTGKAEPILFECKFTEGSQYLLVVVPKILLSQVFHESILNYSNPQ